MMSTNPICVVVPASQEPPFVLDMATSVVAMNKVDLAGAKGEKVPFGWGLDEEGNASDDPKTIWNSHRLLPLGGTRELGSHKGYGLAIMVDILCGVLSGGMYGNRATRRPSDDAKMRASSSHFFAAIRIDAFRPLDEFKADMDDMLRALKDSPKAKGHDRIYVPGEIEHEVEQVRLRAGIPYPPALVARLQELAEEFNVPFQRS
jgi:LDH2 family malate/lactate/ureidoglycolate dehydrogenase